MLVNRLSAESSNEIWTEDVVVGNKMFKAKLDIGAQCNKVSMYILKKLGLQNNIIKSQISTLVSYTDHTIKVVGDVWIECKLKNRRISIKFAVVDQKVSPILGKKTCEDEKRIARIENIENESKAKAYVKNLNFLMA